MITIQLSFCEYFEKIVSKCSTYIKYVILH